MDWKKRYLEAAENFRDCRCDATFLSGFNVNIDRVIDAERILEDKAEPKELEEIRSWSDFQSVLSYCVSNGKNMEIDLEDYRPEIDGGRRFIGGQGGIVSTFASRIGAESVLYTPIISEELADALDDGIMSPLTDGDISLTDIENCVNSEEIKENLIFEFRGEKSGRMILSDDLPGFQPLFSEEWEDNLTLLDSEVDRVFLAGFHHLREENIERAGRQLGMIDSPLHVEYVYTDDRKSDDVVMKILPEADSIGFDHEEMVQILESIEYAEEPESIEEYIEALSEVMNFSEVDRVHLHTYNFHICLVSKDYSITPEEVLDSMLFGEIAAIASAEKGDIPEREDIESFDFEDKHLRGLEEIEKVSENGIEEFDDFYACLIPVVIHERPKRLVGLGDLISARSFFWELFQSQ